MSRPTAPVIPFHDLTNQPSEPPPDPNALQFHPLANVFPAMSREEFDNLVTDIEQHGIVQPIILLDNMILDGRNRYQAWQEAIQTVPGIPLRTEPFDGDDPVAYVLSANINRRMLNESQRAMVLARLSKHSKRGRPAKDAPAALSQKALAEVLKSSPDSGQRARHVLDRGTENLIKRVDGGEITVALAAKVATMSAEEQAEIDKLPESQVRAAWKKTRRERKEALLAHTTKVAAAKLGTSLFGVIYASPPWIKVPGMANVVDSGYPTMTTLEIASTQLPAAADCALFLWVPAAMLEDGLSVLNEWGFTYRNHWIWRKNKVGIDLWGANRHELLLIGTKGYIPAPTASDRIESVQDFDIGKFGVKPPEFRTIIETLFPTTPRLEVFARGKPVPGWSLWGSEVSTAAD